MNIISIKKSKSQELKCKNLNTKQSFKSQDKNAIDEGVDDDGNSKFIENMVKVIEVIAGQKTYTNKMWKEITTFKLKQNLEICVKVTLPEEAMWNLVEKIKICYFTLCWWFQTHNPKNFDGRGNYSLW